jgi:mannose-6-phosphate isomerase
VLEPGEAVFLGAGNLHAYLSGVGMELMANSDNVIRGGLTPKHRDVEELLSVVDCSPIDVPIQRPTADTWSYISVAEEFCLDRIVDPAGTHSNDGPEILFVQHGEVELRSATSRLAAGPGDVVWIPASEEGYETHGEATLWRARVPL